MKNKIEIKDKKWDNYKNFCSKNGLKRNNFNSMKEWAKIGMIY